MPVGSLFFVLSYLFMHLKKDKSGSVSLIIGMALMISGFFGIILTAICEKNAVMGVVTFFSSVFICVALMSALFWAVNAYVEKHPRKNPEDS